MRAKSLLWSAAVLFTLFAYLPVMAQDEAAGTAQRAEDAQKTDSRMSGADAGAPSAPSLIVSYNGGPIKKVLAVTKNTQQTTTSTAFVAVTGASRVVSVPAGTQDTVVVTFSAECELLPSANDGNHSVEVVIRDGATTIFGNGDSSFCGGQDYNQNSLQVVRRLAAGSHTIRVYFRTTNAAREAWLDDWALTILQSD